MPCHNCGAPLVEGVAFCQQCGTPVPPPTSSAAPTVLASQSPYGSPSPNPSSPSGPASQSPYGSPTPYTNYNPSSVPGTGQPYGTPQNPYAETPYNPYGTPPPSSAFTPPPQSNMPPYSSPQSGNIPPYGSPQPGNVPFPAGGFVAQPVKPKRRVGLISALVVALLVIVIIGAVVLSKSPTGSPTNAADATATATHTSPSGKAIDPTAASILTNIEMASAVDKDTLKPTTHATSFRRDTDMYTTFQFDFRSTNVDQQNPGYVRAKYYIDGKNRYTATPLKVDDDVAPDGYGYGYFTVQYNRASTNGIVELYWCRKSNCTDEKLAGTAKFTVH